jgi:hypothetical protein
LRGSATLRRDGVSRDQRRQGVAPDLFSTVRKGTLARVKGNAACFEILHAQQLQESISSVSTDIDRKKTNLVRKSGYK